MLLSVARKGIQSRRHRRFEAWFWFCQALLLSVPAAQFLFEFFELLLNGLSLRMRACQSKVADFDAALRINEQVGRLDVSVHDV